MAQYALSILILFSLCLLMTLIVLIKLLTYLDVLFSSALVYFCRVSAAQPGQVEAPAPAISVKGAVTIR